jgi:hypothetical protein
MVLGTIAMLAVAGMGWPAFVMAVVRQDLGRIGQLLFLWLGIVLVASLIAGLIGLVVSGMLVRLSGESLNQRKPTLSDLIGTIGGFVLRILPLVVLGLVVYLVAFGLVLTPMLLSLGTLGDLNPDPEAIASGVLISMLLMLPVGVLAVFVGVRLLYVIPVISLEEAGGMTALRRAWALTGGAFWRTFGTLLVVYLMVYAVTMVVNMAGQVFMVGALESLGTSANPLSPEFFGGMMSAMAVPLVAQSLLQVVTVPFLQAAITVMYVNRTRELAPPAAHQGYGAPFPQGYGSPQGYRPQPPQGYGPAAPQAPGYGWPPQGQHPAQYSPAWQPPSGGTYPPPPVPPSPYGQQPSEGQWPPPDRQG